MFTEARKLHLIEEMIKVQSEDVLVQIERLLKSTTTTGSAHDFLGVISKKDITLMENAIADGCEQINPDDWK